jgi:hypothetical protein
MFHTHVDKIKSYLFVNWIHKPFSLIQLRVCLHITSLWRDVCFSLDPSSVLTWKEKHVRASGYATTAFSRPPNYGEEIYN